MDEMPGMIRPDLQALPQVKDRMTFLYLEHCTLGRQDGAITVTDFSPHTRGDPCAQATAESIHTFSRICGVILIIHKRGGKFVVFLAYAG